MNKSFAEKIIFNCFCPDVGIKSTTNRSYQFKKKYVPIYENMSDSKNLWQQKY